MSYIMMIKAFILASQLPLYRSTYRAQYKSSSIHKLNQNWVKQWQILWEAKKKLHML
jgi:hypothetical protein